jgi:hypothetical protein
MGGWKKLAIVSSSAAAGIAVVLVLSASALYLYGHRSRPRKDWPPIIVKSTGIRASLITELRSGSVLYGFSVEPISPGFAEDFQRKAASASTKRFTIILRDAANFRLCSEEVGTLISVTGDSGKASALVGEGHLACSPSDYMAAQSWDLTYEFAGLEFEPSASAKVEERRLMSDPQFLSLPSAKQRETLEKITGDPSFSRLSDAEMARFVALMRRPTRKQEAQSSSQGFEAEDRLSSFDAVTNVLVTETGIEFSISGYAHITVIQWAKVSGNAEYHCPLRVSCDAKGSCTIENRWNGQTVQAELLKSAQQDEH